jgi:hypothetical protein
MLLATGLVAVIACRGASGLFGREHADSSRLLDRPGASFRA